MSDVIKSGQSVAVPLDVDGLIERCVGNTGFAERILARFESRCGEDLESLEECRSRQDWGEFGNIAHRLKGSAASVSAAGIAEASEALEELARGECADRIPACLDHLRQEWRRFREFSASLPRPFTRG
jgi:HPt (histidine-containing phosphotransfer) domain-containing protein